VQTYGWNNYPAGINNYCEGPCASGWISAQGPGALCVVEERLNANVYIRILNEIMLPSVVQVFPHNNYLFQQDNCSIHTSALVQNWIRENNINILQWPSKSPDLNPDAGKLRTWSKLFRGFDQVATTKGLASFKCCSHFQRT
jgi:hypothetical protein